MNFICSHCLQHCTSKKVDIGIGPYEFWGQRCIDSHIKILSSCCEADCLDELGCLITIAEYNNYEEDQKTERLIDIHNYEKGG